MYLPRWSFILVAAIPRALLELLKFARSNDPALSLLDKVKSTDGSANDLFQRLLDESSLEGHLNIVWLGREIEVLDV